VLSSEGLVASYSRRIECQQNIRYSLDVNVVTLTCYGALEIVVLLFIIKVKSKG